MIYLVVFLIILTEFISYLIYRSNKDIKELARIGLGKGIKGDIRTFTPRYSEHPLLAFFSNPEFRNSFGVKIHNKYGFRANNDFQDIDNKTVIYCAGASSTYCNFIERNEDTWPALLENRLAEQSAGDRIKVVNGGCGAWNSLQSLIRFSAWVDVLKPKLVIIYHGKNDFSTFINAKFPVKEIHPDYGNIMHSLRYDAMAKTLPIFARRSYIFKILYGRYVNSKYNHIGRLIYDLKEFPTREKVKSVLDSIGAKEIDSIFSRYKSFASLCKYRAIPILLVTQKVTKGLFNLHMGQLNDRIKSLESRADNCFVYDFANEPVDDSMVLMDHVHFSIEGSKIFSNLLKDYIVNNIPALVNGEYAR